MQPLIDFAALALGLLLAAQGTGKALDMEGYREGLRAFRLFPEATIPLIAGAWMVLESAAGASVAAAAAARMLPAVDQAWLQGAGMTGLWLILLFNVAYTVVNGITWARRLPVGNCTCFGTFFPQRLGLSVMVQDVVGIAWAATMLSLLSAVGAG